MSARTSPSKTVRQPNAIGSAAKRSTVAAEENWKYLESRPYRWRKQLYVKGGRLRAFNVWMDMQANTETVERAARNWNLSIEAVEEIVRYCESHADLLDAEAEEERRRLVAAGVKLEPPAAD